MPVAYVQIFKAYAIENETFQIGREQSNANVTVVTALDTMYLDGMHASSCTVSGALDMV